MPNGEMTFFDHIDVLRSHVVRAVVVLFVAALTAFFAKNFIIDTVLFGPISPDFPMNRWINSILNAFGNSAYEVNNIKLNLINTKISGQFNLHMTVAIATGFVITIPYLLWELWRFISPALSPKERMKSRYFVFYVSLCFFTGLLFGYFIISPMTISFLSNYSVSSEIKNMIDVTSYLSTVLNVSLACAIVFELPVLVYFLTKMNIVSSSFLKRYRRHAIFVLVVFAAIITPPDVFSQVLVAIPLLGLYELSIGLAAKVERNRAV